MLLIALAEMNNVKKRFIIHLLIHLQTYEQLK